MYDEHAEFIEWAKTYDTAGRDQRSRAMHSEWLRNLSCPILIVDGTQPVEVLIQYIVRKAQVFAFFGKTVTVTVDRPIGTTHQKHPDIIYPINYGYIAGEIAPDGEDLDVYILGVTEPLTAFTGRVIAIIHRKNDIEDKLVVAPDSCVYNQADVAAAVHFQEQLYKSTIDCLWRKSAGMIIYRREADALRYLLLYQTKSQTWSFPKGHMEAGETDQQTAIREVREEIGQSLTPLPNYRATLSYDLKNGATKAVVLFLAEASGEVAIRKSEIAKYCWVTAEEATELLPHGMYAAILAQAEGRIG
jgi:8-oxo-dGTP pyrophosphatase MutT (NUDIX family)